MISGAAALPLIAAAAAAAQPVPEEERVGFFWDSLRSVFDVCPAVIEDRIDLDDAAALAKWRLAPATAEQEAQVKAGSKLALGTDKEGSLIVGRSSDGMCTVQIGSPGYMALHGAILDVLKTQASFIDEIGDEDRRVRRYRMAIGAATARVLVSPNKSDRTVMVIYKLER